MGYPRQRIDGPEYSIEALELTGRAIAEAMWERLRVVGLRSRRYGMYPNWERIDEADRVAYRELAVIAMDAVREAARAGNGPSPAGAFARAIYAAVERHNVANGYPHPRWGASAAWERENDALRGDWLAIADRAMSAVRQARHARRTVAMLAASSEAA